MKKEEQERLHHCRQFLQHEQRRPCKQAVSLFLLLQLLLERNGCTTVAAHSTVDDHPGPKGFLAQRKNPDGSGPHRSDIRPASLFQCASNPWKCVFGGAIKERAVVPGDQEHPVAPSTSSRGDYSFLSSFVQSDKEESAEKKDTPAGAGTGVSSQTKVELESFLKVETEESGAGGGAAVGQNQDGTSLMPTSGRSFIATTVDVDGGTSDINGKTTQGNPGASSPSSAFPSSPQVPSVRSTGESGSAQQPHGFLAPRFLEMTRTPEGRTEDKVNENEKLGGVSPPAMPGVGASAASTGGYVSRLWGRMRDRGRDLFQGTARAVKGVVPLVAAATKVTIHGLTSAAGALLSPFAFLSPTGKEKVSAIRGTLLDETERLQNAALRKLSQMQGDFVHEDPRVESVFRIFELLPRFIGKLDVYNTPNQRNAAILHYIDLQKKFLRRHWERPGKTSWFDKLIRRMVLGRKGTGVEDEDHQDDQEAADNVGGINAADANNKPDTTLQAPLFPIDGGSGRAAGAGAEIGTEAGVVVQEDQWSIPDEEKKKGNERHLRTFLSRTMDYCDALYRACSVAASVRYAFRDSVSRLKAYIEQDPVIRNTKVITAELTAGLFVQAYAILLDYDTKAVVVVIRGTLSINDVLTDLTSIAVKPEGDDEQGDEFVHDGMYKSAKALSVDESLAKRVRELLDEHGYRKVVLTGHSLGGGTTALLYSLWASDAKFNDVDLFAAAHACPAVASLKFTENHFYDHYDRTRPRRATPAVTGSRFFAATVVGWDVVPRASQTAVHNLQRCVGMLCDWHASGILPSEGSSSSAQGSSVRADVMLPETAGPVPEKISKPQAAASRELWDKAHKEEFGVKLKTDDNKNPQLLVPGENVFFVPFEMGGRAVWQRPTFFDEIVLTANMISTHMPDVYVRELRKALDEIRQDEGNSDSAAVAAALALRERNKD